MKDIFSFDYRDSIRKVVRRELKEKYSVKPTKEKSKVQPAQDCQSKVFGIFLENVPSKSVKDYQYCNIPIFLVDAFEYLNNHLKVEGLFRKSGSVGRQKVLRELLEKDGSCCECEFVQPHDIASLVKQFFRELPDPLLTTRLSPAFLKCASLANTNDSISAMTLCCLLLPDMHLRVLKYFTKFISEMANHSLESKMTLSNLAIVFAPNLVSTTGKDRNSEKSMKDTTQVIDLLFKNSHLIGMVPDALLNKAVNLNPDDGGFLSSSGDELESGLDDNFKRGRTLQRSEKKRDRSKSITGFLRRNFKQGDKNTQKHSRSRTSEKPLRKDWNEKPIVKEFGEPIWKNQSDRPVKRRNNSKTNMSPVRKSPRLVHKEPPRHRVPLISSPILKSVSNQVAATPRRMFQPIQRNCNDELDGKSTKSRLEPTKVLPSKFNFSKTQHQQFSIHSGKTIEPSDTNTKTNRPALSRSKSSVDGFHTQSLVAEPTLPEENGNEVVTSSNATTIHKTTQQQSHLPQPKISRATQKPHVRKSRRTSSLDRRRARYASSTKVRRQLPKRPDEKNMTDNSISTTQNDPANVDDVVFITSRIFDENLTTFTATKPHTATVTALTKTAPLTTAKDVLKTVESKINNNNNKNSINNSANQISPAEGKMTSVTKKTTRIRRRLPKASSFGDCQSPSSPSTNENKNPTTPTNKRLSRSSTSIRKPSTPYSLTPQIGSRSSKPLPPLFL